MYASLLQQLAAAPLPARGTTCVGERTAKVPTVYPSGLSSLGATRIRQGSFWEFQLRTVASTPGGMSELHACQPDIRRRSQTKQT